MTSKEKKSSKDSFLEKNEQQQLSESIPYVDLTEKLIGVHVTNLLHQQKFWDQVSIFDYFSVKDLFPDNFDFQAYFLFIEVDNELIEPLQACISFLFD